MNATHARQLALPWPHRASSERDDLIVTPANSLAVEAVDAWPDWPHPVLYVWGPAGSGKSHLAQSWATQSGATRFCDSAEVEAAKSSFRIVAEDIDRERPSEAALFALVNAARLGGGSLLVTARVPPGALALSTPDLASRLRAAGTVAIGAPDDALLGGVLAKLFADRQIEIDARLLSLIVSRMERSLDGARRFVARIDDESLATGRKVGRGLVLDLLRQDAASLTE